MMPSPQSLDSAQASPRLQRQRTVANAAASSATQKRTTRASRTPNKTSALEASGVQDSVKLTSSEKTRKAEAATTDKVPPPLDEEAAPKKTKQPREVKQKIQDNQEQKTPAAEIPTNAKRKGKIEEIPKPAGPQIDRDSPIKIAKRKRIVKIEEAEVEVGEPPSKKAKRKQAAEGEVDDTFKDEASPTKAKSKTKVKEEDERVQEGEEAPKRTKPKRKTKEEKELEAMPLAVRTDGLRMFIGAHVSGAKGRSSLSYIAALELRPLFESRSPQCSLQLRSYWVNRFQTRRYGHD